MELTDITEIIVVSGIIFFLLGFFGKSFIQKSIDSLRRVLLKPRYLKSAGFLSKTDNATPTKNTHD